MKRLLLILMSLLIGMTVYAQELRVIEITEVENSAKARTAKVKDKNGELCALVEVAIPSVKGILFDKNQVCEYTYEGGTYLVFVPAGTKRINFKHEDFFPGTIEFNDLKIEGGVHYLVKLQKYGVGPASITQSSSTSVTEIAQNTTPQTVARTETATENQSQTNPAQTELVSAAGIDLSSAGTANSYIVSSAGTYKFKTVKGNSTESVGAVASVEVLWESFGTDTAPSVGDLVNTVSYASNYITFTATSKKGNAVIAAKNSSGTILWSWHIWLTDKPEDQVYNNNAGTMMDRNLGATSATPGDVQALGLLYQWGRKDPFLNSSSISSSNQAKSTYSWPSSVSSDSSTGTIAYSVSHPTTFITYNSSNDDWYYTGSLSTDNTRWQKSDKDKGLYDPCPPGYRVPDGGSSGIWSKAFGTSSSWTTSSNWDSTYKGMNFGATDKKLGSSPTIWYPASGYLSSSAGSLSPVGNYGSYWSASPRGYVAYYLYFSSSGYVSPSNYDYRAYGRSVRCVRE